MRFPKKRGLAYNKRALATAKRFALFRKTRPALAEFDGMNPPSLAPIYRCSVQWFLAFVSLFASGAYLYGVSDNWIGMAVYLAVTLLGVIGLAKAGGRYVHCLKNPQIREEEKKYQTKMQRRYGPQFHSIFLTGFWGGLFFTGLLLLMMALAIEGDDWRQAFVLICLLLMFSDMSLLSLRNYYRWKHYLEHEQQQGEEMRQAIRESAGDVDFTHDPEF